MASIKEIDNNKQNNLEVSVLTDSNYKEYVDHPDYILKKYDLVLITKAQFSDILRVNLLYHHGGFWIDSTVYMMKRIDSKIIESNDFITLCDDKDNNSIGISQGRWTGYFMYSKRDSQEFEFLVCLFNNYWKSEDKLINYFLIDYAISLTYDKFPEFRRKVHMGGLDGANKFLMDKLLQSRDVSALQINSLINDRTGIFKLSHKNFYNKNKVYVDLIEEIDCVNNQNSCDL